MKEMVEDYVRVYQMLADEESREIYLARVNYRISGDIRYIQNIVRSYLPDFPPVKGTPKDFFDALPKDRDIVLYGAGGFARETQELWMKHERIIGFCSANKKKQAAGYLGYPVMSPEELLKRKDLTVAICTVLSRDEIMQILLDNGYPEEQIYDITLYSIREDPGQYFNPAFMRYEDEEVFVDAGCYNLGSSIELRKYCRHVKKVYAFEPDPASYQRCLERKEETDFPEAEVLPFGTWSEETTLHFNANHTSGSCVSDEGQTSVAVKPIDAVVDPKDRVTFIKMDIEGAELESLKGAKDTILRDKPKLAICIYHKPEDLISIPLYIKELVPNYQFYIRHHSSSATDTVLYAVMP